jgi:conjugative relaxase-like TrwC/TraI family protein
MLKISKALSAGKVSSYYEQEYTNRGEAYYSQEGQRRGEWHGRLAVSFGLSGGVAKEHFDRLSQGQDPHSGLQLIEHRDTIKTKTGEEVGHRAAWDLTFGAPKTVSLTALVGGDERVAEAHRQAVRVALDATEKYVQARRGGDWFPETTGQWVAALFEHDTARPVDGYPAPHLHTHVVMFNMTEAQDKIRSLDTRELFRVQSMSTAVYQAELAQRLKGFGYELELGKNRSVEIKGYSREYRDAASARSIQITEQMREKGVDGAEAAERIAHQTCEGKRVWIAEDLKAAHLAEAARFGNQPQLVIEAARVRQSQREHVVERPNSSLAHEAITYAKHRLSERTAVFDEPELVRDALRYQLGAVSYGEVSNAFRERVDQANREFVRVDHHRAHAPGLHLTTVDMLRKERETIELVRRGLGSMQPMAPGIDRDSLDAHYRDRLNEGQRDLVWSVLQSQDKVFGVQGGAGTGKTTALRPLRDWAEAAGYETRGLAPTSGAAHNLAEAGIPSETLQAHLQRKSTNLTQPCLYFLDESSLASTKQIHDFLTRLRQNDHVLLIGDTRQHQSVEAGRIFEELQEAGMPTYRLDQIVRQKDEHLKAAVAELAAGNIENGIQILHNCQRIHESPDRHQRFAAIARSYAEAPQGTLVISTDNESRKAINAAIRNALHQTGALDVREIAMPVLVNRKDLTSADRARAEAYHPGDVVQYTSRNKTVGVAKGEYATVVGVDYEDNTITVQRQRDGRQVTYAVRRVSGVQVFEPEQRAYAVGERIQFTAPWKAQDISNRDLATVTAVDTNGTVTAQLDKNRRTLTWNLADHPHLDHGYTMTSYSAQGTTVDRVLVQIETENSRTRQLVDKTLAYVALSRPRYDLQIYTDNQEALAPALSRDVSKPKALSREQIQEYRESSVPQYVY